MVINETIEFSQKDSARVPYLSEPVVFLIDHQHLLSHDEIEVVERLQKQSHKSILWLS